MKSNLRNIIMMAMIFTTMTAAQPASASEFNETIIVAVKNVEIIEETPEAYSKDDIAELARIVYWEARGETIEGQLAVANVVVNRKNTDGFPSTIKGVISQTNQFSPYERSNYYDVSVPDEYYSIAEMALAGDSVVSENVLWFRSDKKPDTWNKAVYAISIGGHHFYEI